MYIQIECASSSDTILFAGSELKHYLSKINNSLSFFPGQTQKQKTVIQPSV